MPRCLKLYGHLLPACDRTWTPSELSTQIMPPGSQMYSPKPWAVRFRSVFYPSPPLPTSTNGLVKTAPTRSRQFQSEWVLDCSLAPFDFNNATTRSHPHPVARFKAVAPLGPAYCTSAPHSSSNCTSSGSSRKGANSSGLSPPDILAPASLESAFNNSATRSVRPAPYLRPDQTHPSVLRHIFGQIKLAHQTQAHAIDRTFAPVDQAGKRPSISRLRLYHQGF